MTEKLTSILAHISNCSFDQYALRSLCPLLIITIDDFRFHLEIVCPVLFDSGERVVRSTRVAQIHKASVSIVPQEPQTVILSEIGSSAVRVPL